MFNTTVNRYATKFYDLKNKLSDKTISCVMNQKKMTKEEVEAGLKANSEEFRLFALAVAKTMMPGRVSCTTYAAVCSYLLDSIGVENTAKAGFCLPRNYPAFSKEVTLYNEKKSAGVIHPMPATHVFVEANGMVYEFYNGETSNIEHIDCEVLPKA